MGSGSVLVIGEQPLQQIERYQNEEYAPPLSPFMTEINTFDRAREERDYAQSKQFIGWRHPDGRVIQRDGTGLTPDETRNVERLQAALAHCTPLHEWVSARQSFDAWLGERYSGPRLGPDEVPDRAGAHRGGWVRVDAHGRVVEVIWRHMPDNFYFFVTADMPYIRLKPGARGWRLGLDGTATEVTGGNASSAYKGDVDWEAMRCESEAECMRTWDAVHRIAAGRVWLPRAELRAHHPVGEKWDEALEQVVSRQWAEQPAIRDVIDTPMWPGTNIRLPQTYQELDLMLQPREAYVTMKLARKRLLHWTQVVRDGVLIEPDPPSEAELLATASDATRLTCIAYKC